MKNYFRPANLFLYLYLGGGVFFVFTIETHLNAMFFFSIKFLSIPVLVLSFILVYRSSKTESKSKINKLGLVGISVLYGFIYTTLSGPYIALFNSILPPQETVKITGKIVKKHKAGKHGKGRAIELDKKNKYGDNFQFRVGNDYYDKVSIGDVHTRTMKIGGLGFVYRWRI